MSLGEGSELGSHLDPDLWKYFKSPKKYTAPTGQNPQHCLKPVFFILKDRPRTAIAYPVEDNRNDEFTLR